MKQYKRSWYIECVLLLLSYISTSKYYISIQIVHQIFTPPSLTEHHTHITLIVRPLSVVHTIIHYMYINAKHV